MVEAQKYPRLRSSFQLARNTTARPYGTELECSKRLLSIHVVVVSHRSCQGVLHHWHDHQMGVAIERLVHRSNNHCHGHSVFRGIDWNDGNDNDNEDVTIERYYIVKSMLSIILSFCCHQNMYSNAVTFDFWARDRGAIWMQ